MSSLYTYIHVQHLAVQQRGDLFAEVLNDGIGATLDLQTGRDSVQLDVGDDRAGDLVDLLGLLVGPHGGTELCGVLVGDLAEERYRSCRGIWDRDSDIPSGMEMEGNVPERRAGAP